MAMLLILLLCLSSVYSEEMRMGMMKNMISEKMDDSAMAVSKLKRDSYHHPSTPCPPYYHPHPVVHQPQYVHKPVVTVVKPHPLPSYHMPHVPQYHQPHVPQYHHPVIPQYHHPVVPQYHRPIIPQYHRPVIHKPAVIVKPDCPPYHHPHSPHRTGIVYAPQHQYHHQPSLKYVHPEPQYVKVVKPVYHRPPVYHPPPVYHQPVYHHPHPSPPVHVPVHVPSHPVHVPVHVPSHPVHVPVHVPSHPVHVPVHVPKVEICDK